MTVCSDETGQEGVTGRAGDTARGAPAHLSLGGICPARAWGTQAASPTDPGLGPGSVSLAGRPGRVPQLSGPGLLSQQGPGRPVVMCPHSCLLLLSPSGMRTGSAISRPGTWRMSE